MGARAMIDCICCGRCGKWATATGGGMCEACVVRETRDTEITALRAELEKVRCELDDAEERASEAEERCAAEWEKDCGQALRILAQVTKFEWDQDGSPADEVREHIQMTLESLEKQLLSLRAELAAAKERAKALETAVFDAHFRAFASRHYEYVGPGTTLDLLVADIRATQHERTALAAHVERLREKGFKMRAAISGAWSADRMTSVADSLRPVIQDLECDRDALAATPAQSLAAHDAALLREVAVEIDALAAGPDIDTVPTRLEDIANGIRAKADRIEKEAPHA